MVGIAGVVCVSVVYSVNEVNEKTGCVLLGVRGETGDSLPLNSVSLKEDVF